MFKEIDENDRLAGSYLRDGILLEHLIARKKLSMQSYQGELIELQKLKIELKKWEQAIIRGIYPLR